MTPGTDSTQLTIPLPDKQHRGIDRYSVALILEPATFGDLFAEVQRIAASRDGRTFVTLDELGQCQYTSGHARNKHDLDRDTEYPSDDSDEARERYEAEVFASALARLASPDTQVSWNELADTMLVDAADVEALVALNREPGALLDERHVVQHVPSSSAWALLANIPNGYFECDWSPFQNLAITKRLFERHGYEPWGIGARTLGFVSTLDDARRRDIDSLIDDLKQLYGHPDAAAWVDLAAVLATSPVLILGYTEDFAELAS